MKNKHLCVSALTTQQHAIRFINCFCVLLCGASLFDSRMSSPFSPPSHPSSLSFSSSSTSPITEDDKHEVKVLNGFDLNGMGEVYFNPLSHCRVREVVVIEPLNLNKQHSHHFSPAHLLLLNEAVKVSAEYEESTAHMRLGTYENEPYNYEFNFKNSVNVYHTVRVGDVFTNYTHMGVGVFALGDIPANAVIMILAGNRLKNNSEREQREKELEAVKKQRYGELR